MRRYPRSISRAAAAVAATALSALTLGLLVAVPASVAISPLPAPPASTAPTTAGERVVKLGRIEVAASRVPEVAEAPEANEPAVPKRGS
jgi:hypothetical protein